MIFSILGLDSEKANFQKSKVKSNPTTKMGISSGPMTFYFYFSLENDPKGGPLDDFFSILGLDSEKANFQNTKVKSNPSLT